MRDTITVKLTDEPVGLAGYIYEASAIIDGEEIKEWGDTKIEAIRNLKGEIKEWREDVEASLKTLREAMNEN